MQDIFDIKLQEGSKEELLPGFTAEFPYIASRVFFYRKQRLFVPWHWHTAIELFYVEKGSIEYHTPSGTCIFPKGSAGMVNSNVLHMTVSSRNEPENIQLLHLFDPIFISGNIGSRIERNYVLPITNASDLELISIFPDSSEHEVLLQLIRDSLSLSDSEVGYELKLRSKLSEIWLKLYEMVQPLRKTDRHYNNYSDKIKLMLAYIQKHFAEKITVFEIAASAYLSERECYRIFKNYLHMSPIDYLNSYRIQMACQMLQTSSQSMTYISHECGFGSSSYFGKLFKEYVGCTPLEYRNGKLI